MKNDYPHFQVPLTTDLQAVACRVRIGRLRLTICSLYLPPNEPIVLADLNNLLPQLPQPFMICSDANSRHFLWGADRCDRRGAVWEHIIRQHALNVLNDGRPTRLDEYTGLWSHIDITLSTGDVSQYMTWTTDDDLYSSDHCPIYVSCNINEGVTSGENVFLGWNIDKANWTEFVNRCQLRFQGHLGMRNCSIMTEELIRVAKSCIPQRSGQAKYSCPWWTEECKQAIRDRKKALNRFRRSHLTATLMAYKRAKAKARQVVRRAKKESWEKLLHMFSHRTPVHELWALIRKFTKKERIQRTLPVLDVGGTVLDNPYDVGNALGRFYSEVSSSDNYRPVFRNRVNSLLAGLPTFSSDNTEEYNAEFTLDELQRSVASCGNTSVGPDHIHYAFFKHLSEVQLIEVLNMINYIWCTENFPLQWKHSIIIPILKPGKPANKPDSYRPIQLTSCFSKLMERMVANRLTWYADQQHLLSNYQCAFKKGRSTSDHLIRLESEVRQGFFYNRYTLAVFLDLKSAYNLTSTVALMSKMYNLGFRGRLMGFLDGYLNGRTFQVKCGVLSDTFVQENGLVQGGVISPILFNIAINDIFSNVPAQVSRALYADDCTMWLQGRHIRTLIAGLQDALNQVIRWTDDWGFIFSPAKCHSVIFRRYMKAQELEGIPALTVYDQPVQYSDHAKFLGVIFDTKLNFNRHVQYIKTKALKRLPILKCLAGRGCGADRTVLLRIYKTMIRPILDYASQVLDGPDNKAVEALECIQNQCLRIATGALRTSPVLPLLVETNTYPLRLRRMDLTIRYSMKMLSRDNHPCQQILAADSALHTVDRSYMKRISGFPLLERLNAFCHDIQFVFPPILAFRRSLVPPWKPRAFKLEKLTMEPKALLTPAQAQADFQEYRSLHHDFTFFFTDGSKIAEGVGCAFVCGDRLEQYKLPAVCSIFTAEAAAILQVLQYIQHNRLQKCVICTDSFSVVCALNDTTSEHPIVNDIILLSHQLADNGCTLIILWVPGHCNIAGNVIADTQAKAAVHCDRLLDIDVGYTDHLSTLRHAINERFNQMWVNYRPTTSLKDVKDMVGHWDTCKRQNRREEIILCRLRLGHTRYTHSYILDHDPQPQCDRCRCPRSVKHFLLECPVFANQRRALLNVCRAHEIPATMRTVLGNDFPDILDEIFRFLRDCQLMKLL